MVTRAVYALVASGAGEWRDVATEFSATSGATPPLLGMSTRPIEKAWFLLLAANNTLRARSRREQPFFALPCETLEDLATQLELHNRSPKRAPN